MEFLSDTTWWKHMYLAGDLTSNGSSPATAYASFKGAWDKALSNNAAGQIIQFLPDTYLQGYDYDHGIHRIVLMQQ